MPIWMIEPFDDVDWGAFRDNSQQLDEFLEGDFSSMIEELDRAMENHDGQIPQRYVPLVERFAQEQATLYVQEAFRTFGGVDAGARAKLLEVYLSSDMDGMLHQLHRRLTGQRTMIAGIVPISPRKVRPMSWAPWEVEVTPATGSRVHDITAAQHVRIRWPLGTIAESAFYGTLNFTQTDAWIEGDGKRSPVYPGGGNPYGYIPLACARINTPKSGRFYGAVDEPLLSAAIGLNLGEGDREAIAHHQAWGQKVVKFSGDQRATEAMIDKMPVGPNRVMVMPVEGAEFEIVQGVPQIDQYARMDEARLKTLAMMRDMSPNRFMKANTAQTGAARQADREDREEARRAWKKIFLRLENDLLRIVADTSRIYGDPVPVPESATVASVRWASLRMIADPAQEANANTARDASGEDSPVDRVARARNVGRDLAKKIVLMNMIDTLSLKAAAKQEVGADASAVLNGAQVTAALETVRAVAAGEITATAAAKLISQSFGIPIEVATEIVGNPTLREPDATVASGPMRPQPTGGDDDRQQQPAGTAG